MALNSDESRAAPSGPHEWSDSVVDADVGNRVVRQNILEKEGDSDGALTQSIQVIRGALGEQPWRMNGKELRHGQRFLGRQRGGNDSSTHNAQSFVGQSAERLWGKHPRFAGAGWAAAFGKVKRANGKFGERRGGNEWRKTEMAGGEANNCTLDAWGELPTARMDDRR